MIKNIFIVAQTMVKLLGSMVKDLTQAMNDYLLKPESILSRLKDPHIARVKPRLGPIEQAYFFLHKSLRFINAYLNGSKCLR